MLSHCKERIKIPNRKAFKHYGTNLVIVYSTKPGFDTKTRCIQFGENKWSYLQDTHVIGPLAFVSVCKVGENLIARGCKRGISATNDCHLYSSTKHTCCLP